jgi:hypothetical protein
MVDMVDILQPHSILVPKLKSILRTVEESGGMSQLHVKIHDHVLVFRTGQNQAFLYSELWCRMLR